MSDYQPVQKAANECDHHQRRLLDHDWSGRRLAEARALLEHLDQCERCRAALVDYDRLREALHQENDQATGDVIEPVGGWTAFEDRLAAMVPSADPAVSFKRPRTLLALAAMVLVGLCGWALYLGQLSQTPAPRHIAAEQDTLQHDGQPGRETAASSRAISVRDVRQNTALFESVSQVFEGRASWVAVAEDQSEVGLSTSATPSDRLLLVRLVLSRQGRVLSSADLAILSGQAAQLAVPIGSDGADQRLRLRVRVSAQQPPVLGLSAELLERGQPDALGTLSTTLRPSPGQVLTAGELQTTRGRYRLDVTFVEAGRPASRLGLSDMPETSS